MNGGGGAVGDRGAPSPIRFGPGGATRGIPSDPGQEKEGRYVKTIVGATLLLALPATAIAQPDALHVGWASVAGESFSMQTEPRTLSTLAESRPAPTLALGGLLGGAAGFVGGFYVGALLADGDDADDLDFLSGGVAGATIGEGLLLPLGVHLANDRQGSFLTSAAASLAIAAAGLLALQAAHYDPPAAPIVLVAVPVAQLVASIAIERATD